MQYVYAFILLSTKLPHACVSVSPSLSLWHSRENLLNVTRLATREQLSAHRMQRLIETGTCDPRSSAEAPGQIAIRLPVLTA